MKFNRELLKGHLKTIILSVLQDGASHAYGLQKRVHQKSLGVFELSEGTLYPTLHKIEKDGLIESIWVEREGKPKIRNYSLTPKGQKSLEEMKTEWDYFSRAMKMVLKPEEI